MSEDYLKKEASELADQISGLDRPSTYKKIYDALVRTRDARILYISARKNRYFVRYSVANKTGLRELFEALVEIDVVSQYDTIDSIFDAIRQSIVKSFADKRKYRISEDEISVVLINMIDSEIR